MNAKIAMQSVALSFFSFKIDHHDYCVSMEKLAQELADYLVIRLKE